VMYCLPRHAASVGAATDISGQRFAAGHLCPARSAFGQDF